MKSQLFKLLLVSIGLMTPLSQLVQIQTANAGTLQCNFKVTETTVTEELPISKKFDVPKYTDGAAIHASAAFTCLTKGYKKHNIVSLGTVYDSYVYNFYCSDGQRTRTLQQHEVRKLECQKIDACVEKATNDSTVTTDEMSKLLAVKKSYCDSTFFFKL